MKRTSSKLFLYSLTSLATISSCIAYAEENEDRQFVSVPVFEGGISASIGTFFATPNSDFQTYYISNPPTSTSSTATNVTPDYSWGIDASLGYVFEDTANAIDILYRNITTSDTSSAIFPRQNQVTGACSKDPGCVTTTDGDLGYELETGDIVISQFIDIGRNMQMQFFGGLSYVDLEYNLHNTNVVTDTDIFRAGLFSENSSRFAGWGPRIGIDSRYDFGDDIEGFGIVGGGSVAFYLGDLNINSNSFRFNENGDGFSPSASENDLDNHTINNLRANLGIDYVYFFDNHESTLGLELGYMVDYYDDAAGVWDGSVENGEAAQTSAVSFSGPYLNLKGIF
jgi:hypothetical protein